MRDAGQTPPDSLPEGSRRMLWQQRLHDFVTSAAEFRSERAQNDEA